MFFHQKSFHCKWGHGQKKCLRDFNKNIGTASSQNRKVAFLKLINNSLSSENEYQSCVCEIFFSLFKLIQRFEIDISL